MKKMFIIGFFLLAHYVCAAAETPSSKDECILKGYKSELVPQTGEQILYLEKYGNYKNFNKQFVTNLLTKRLEMLLLLSKEPNNQEISKSISSNEISIVSNADDDEIIKIFKFYDERSSQSQHILDVLELLRGRLPEDNPKTEKAREKLNGLIEKYTALHQEKMNLAITSVSNFLKINDFYTKIELIKTIAAIATIPLTEREKTLEQAKSFLSGDLRVIYSEIEALIAIPQEERKSTLEQLKPFWDKIYHCFGYRRAEILKAIKNIPLEERKSTLEQVEFFLSHITTDNNKISIDPGLIEAISPLPLEERKNVLEQAIPFLKNIKYQETRAKILKAIVAIQIEERKSTLEQAAPFLEGVSEFDKENILKTIAAIPPEERALVLEQALIVQGIASQEGRYADYPHYQKEKVIKAIASTPLEKRVAIFERAKPILKDIFGNAGKADFIEILAAVSLEEKEAFNELVSPFLDELSGNDQMTFVKAVAAIPLEERKGVLEQAAPFLKELTLMRDGIPIVEAIAAIPPEERALVLEQVKPFWNYLHRFSGKAKSEVMKTIADVPQEEQETLLKQVEPFLKSYMCDESKAAMVRASVAIPPTERKSVLEQATLLTIQASQDKNEYYYGAEKVIEAIAAISPEERKSTLEQVIPFLNKSGRGENVACVIKNIAAIPMDERTFTFEQATPFLQGIEWGGGKVEIIKTIRGIPLKERKETLKHAMHFLKDCTSGFYLENERIEAIVELIKAIGSIPLKERMTVFEQATLFMRDIFMGNLTPIGPALSEQREYDPTAFQVNGKFLAEEAILIILEYTAIANYLINGSIGDLGKICKYWHHLIKQDKNKIKKSIDSIIYQKFLNGRLIYKPNEDSDDGKIELRVSDLPNPLEGTFDLSQCGTTGEYLSISTGYRKVKKAENAKKIEIWFAPRFLIEKELTTKAKHFQPVFQGIFKSIYGKWNQGAEIGIFWTWGAWNKLGWYDHLITQDMDNISNNNLYEKWMHDAKTFIGNRAFFNASSEGTKQQRKFTFIL